jgi:hypothetical protein
LPFPFHFEGNNGGVVGESSSLCHAEALVRSSAGADVEDDELLLLLLLRLKVFRFVLVAIFSIFGY